MFQTNRGRSSGSPHIRQSSHPYDSDFQNRRTFSEAYSCGYSSGIETTFRTGFPITAIPRRCGRATFDSTGSKGKAFLRTIKRSRRFPVIFFAHFVHKRKKPASFTGFYRIRSHATFRSSATRSDRTPRSGLPTAGYPCYKPPDWHACTRRCGTRRSAPRSC